MTTVSTKARRGVRAAARARKPRTPAIGDIYLACLPDLQEVEVEDFEPRAKVIKLKGRGWIAYPAFAKSVKVKLGRAIYCKGLLSTQRKFVRESESLS